MSWEQAETKKAKGAKTEGKSKTAESKVSKKTRKNPSVGISQNQTKPLMERARARKREGSDLESFQWWRVAHGGASRSSSEDRTKKEQVALSDDVESVVGYSTTGHGGFANRWATEMLSFFCSETGNGHWLDQKIFLEPYRISIKTPLRFF
jgi:hypothetical protein